MTTKHLTYLQVAHDGRGEYASWRWENGEVRYEKNSPHVGLNNSNYTGRFCYETKNLSIGTADRTKQVPNSLIKKLYETFGDDIKIWLDHEESGTAGMTPLN